MAGAVSLRRGHAGRRKHAASPRPGDGEPVKKEENGGHEKNP